MSFVARGKGGKVEGRKRGKIEPRIRITESFVIANRKRRRRYGARGTKLTEVSVRNRLRDASRKTRRRRFGRSRYPPRALRWPRDRSIPFLVPANKDARTDEHGPSGTLARITRQLVTSLHSPTLARECRR